MAIFVAIVSLIVSCSSDKKPTFVYEKVISLDSVSNKSVKYVGDLLGEGTKKGFWKDKRAGCKKCPRIFYDSGKLEVIFINGVADRITVNDVGYPFEEDIILQALGLAETNPSFKNDFVIRWENIPGYREIAAFNNDGKINYILVKTNAD